MKKKEKLIASYTRPSRETPQTPFSGSSDFSLSPSRTPSDPSSVKNSSEIPIPLHFSSPSLSNSESNLPPGFLSSPLTKTPPMPSHSQNTRTMTQSEKVISTKDRERSKSKQEEKYSDGEGEGGDRASEKKNRHHHPHSSSKRRESTGSGHAKKTRNLRKNSGHSDNEKTLSPSQTRSSQKISGSVSAPVDPYLAQFARVKPNFLKTTPNPEVPVVISSSPAAVSIGSPSIDAYLAQIQGVPMTPPNTVCLFSFVREGRKEGK